MLKEANKYPISETNKIEIVYKTEKPQNPKKQLIPKKKKGHT